LIIHHVILSILHWFPLATFSTREASFWVSPFLILFPLSIGSFYPGQLFPLIRDVKLAVIGVFYHFEIFSSSSFKTDCETFLSSFFFKLLPVSFALKF
jgi:hypothetical protein